MMIEEGDLVFNVLTMVAYSLRASFVCFYDCTLGLRYHTCTHTLISLGKDGNDRRR